MENLNVKKTYFSKGTILGIVWAGYEATYPCKEYHSKISVDDLLEQNQKVLNNNTLQPNGDFQRLIGAKLIVDTISELEYEGKIYCHVESEEHFIGELNDEQIDAFYFNEY